MNVAPFVLRVYFQKRQKLLFNKRSLLLLLAMRVVVLIGFRNVQRTKVKSVIAFLCIVSCVLNNLTAISRDYFRIVDFSRNR